MLNDKTPRKLSFSRAYSTTKHSNPILIEVPIEYQNTEFPSIRKEILGE
jgi:hypothetical protein